MFRFELIRKNWAFGRYSEDTAGRTLIELNREDADLGELVETFEYFLRACGYHFGSVEITPENYDED